jgi:hypothetical protein
MKERLTPEEFVRLARALPVNERVPYAFEKRIMARLGAGPIADAFSAWTHVLWRAMAPCVGIMLVALAISFASWSADATPENESADLEATVFAPTQVAFDLSR